jgi:hypothetical protein
MQQEVRAEADRRFQRDFRLTDLPEQIGEVTIMISSDKAQAAASAGSVEQSLQLVLQGGHGYGPVNNVAQEHQLLGAIPLLQGFESIERIVLTSDRQKQAGLALRPRIPQVKVRHDEGLVRRIPQRAAGIQPKVFTQGVALKLS